MTPTAVASFTCGEKLCVDDFNAFAVFQRVVLIYHRCIIDLFITSFYWKYWNKMPSWLNSSTGVWPDCLNLDDMEGFNQCRKLCLVQSRVTTMSSRIVYVLVLCAALILTGCGMCLVNLCFLRKRRKVAFKMHTIWEWTQKITRNCFTYLCWKAMGFLILRFWKEAVALLQKIHWFSSPTTDIRREIRKQSMVISILWMKIRLSQRSKKDSLSVIIFSKAVRLITRTKVPGYTKRLWEKSQGRFDLQRCFWSLLSQLPAHPGNCLWISLEKPYDGFPICR